MTDPNPWLGDNTAEDWDDSRYLFWAVLDPHTGEQVNISRNEPKRDKRGYIKAGERDARSRWCEEHFDFELSMTLITGYQALAWAHDLYQKREAEGTTVGAA